MVDAKRILVVDDEADAREFVKAILETEHFEVHLAEGGDLGLALARSLKPDVIILDIQMPGKDGFEVYSEIRRDSDLANVKVIMLTGVAAKTGIDFDADSMGQYFGEKPDEYIEKPVDPDKLIAAVRSVLV